ncbi:MAG: acyl-CoA dehydrogenase family protein [Desulfobulbaceae bacterium]|jgi:alkylation response protein AidB-like acyl-CoA dehydrogenase|nr:acyl-CoA dehydrogenase family protein [Desulfobulbaceae bacterium]
MNQLDKEKVMARGGGFMLQETDIHDIFTPEDFTDEHREMARTTERFAVEEIWPVNDRIEEKDFDLVLEKLRQCAELGLMMIDAPEEYGGLHLDKAASMLVSEKLAWSRGFSLSCTNHTGIGMLPLIYYGTPEQKERYLKKMVKGEIIGAYGLTEPGSGSDALGARTVATLTDDGKHYLLTGSKQFITNAGFADLFTVFAKVDKKHFTAFLVERNTPGLSLGPEEKKMGLHGSSTCQVIFDAAPVPKENLLGEIGKGHKIAFNVLNVGRFKLGAICVGQTKFALAEGSRYANERKQFGRLIGSFGAIQEKLADATALAFAAESAVYRLAGLLDGELSELDRNSADYYTLCQKVIEGYAAECALVKVLCTEVGAQVISEMLQVHGGYGYIAGHAIEQMYRDERVHRIFEGTSEINRLLVASRLLRQVAVPPPPAASGVWENSWAGQRQLLTGMRECCLLFGKRARQQCGDTLDKEQEILLAYADMAIQLFALEGVTLRAAKACQKASAVKDEQFRAVALLCAFTGRQRFLAAAERCASFLASEDLLPLMVAKTPLAAGSLLAAKRLLATATLQAEKYIF